MYNFFILFILIIAFLKIYIAISKFLNFKEPFNFANKLVIPILIFEILTIIIAIFYPNLYNLTPTIVQILGNNFNFINISLYSILYVGINTLLIITTLGLSDSFIPSYNTFLAIHFIISSMFTIIL